MLAALATEGNPGSTPSKLADVSGVSASAMTHRLDRMVERGLVNRTQDPDNRTRMIVTLTGDGRDLFRRAVLDAEVVESRLLAPLNERDRRQLARVLDTLVAELKPTH